MLMIYTHLKQQGRCPSMLCRSASEALQFNQASYPRLQASLRCTAAVRTEAQHTVGPKVELVGGVPTVVERVAEVPTAGSGRKAMVVSTEIPSSHLGHFDQEPGHPDRPRHRGGPSIHLVHHLHHSIHVLHLHHPRHSIHRFVVHRCFVVHQHSNRQTAH